MASAHARYVRDFKNWEFPELDNAARVFEQLKASPGWAVLQTLLDVEREKIESLLRTTDKPLEQAEYAMHHGRLDGVLASRHLVDAVLAKHEERVAEMNRSAERV